MSSATVGLQEGTHSLYVEEVRDKVVVLRGRGHKFVVPYEKKISRLYGRLIYSTRSNTDLFGKYLLLFLQRNLFILFTSLHRCVLSRRSLKVT